MQYDHLLVRYGELTLKGTNRKMFVNQLKDNVKRALIPLSGYHVKGKRDRMYIELSPEADINEIIQRLSKVYGIKSISPVIKIDKNEEKINQSAIQLSHDFEKGSTFKVDVKRVDKSFRLDTYELQRQVGGAILKENNNITEPLKVWGVTDLTSSSVNLRICGKVKSMKLWETEVELRKRIKMTLDKKKDMKEIITG